MKDIKKEEVDSQQAHNITNNTLFVGSTKELQDMVKKQAKEIQDDVIDVEVIDGKQE